jgi:sugar lactone lactonase YvrE
MSRITAASVRSARIFSGLILVAAFVFLSPQALFAGSTTAAPQLLPYTVSIVAGGGTYGVTANKYTVGNYCGTNTSTPPSGTPPSPLASWPTALSTVGDGCLATQVAITSPNTAAFDSEGNVFIVDFTNRLIRRVDAHTGIISTVAGATTTATITPPASNPGSGSACPYGGGTSSDAWGDGCLATSVLMDNPQDIALDSAGNIWFTDYALDAVRMINKSTGILSTVVNTAFTAGYTADNVAYTKTGILAANGKLYRPYGLTFDNNGNLYIADNYNSVVDVVNLGSTARTIAGYTVGAGEIFTIAGAGCPYTTTPGCTASSYYGKTPAAGNSIISTSAMLDSPYQIAVDNAGNIYIADEYNYSIRVINGTTGMLTSFANNTFTRMTNLARGVALTTTLGSTYGVATDSLGNVYISTSLASSPNWANFIARVDIATGEIYPVAGQHATAVPTAGTAQTGATYCTAKTDAIGDGCPGTQATFWKPYQPLVDAAGNLYVTDTGDNLIRKISVGTQFPTAAVGTPVTQKIEVHFGVGDTAASYTVPDGFTEFVVGAPSCGVANSDGTTDCVLPVTFTPAQAGVRTAPLNVTATPSGLVSNFSLTGIGLAPALAVDPGTQNTLASTGVASVNSIALDAAGNVYASVPGSSSIATFTSAGTPSTLGTGLTGAIAVAVDAAGNVYAALSSGSAVEIPANGTSQVTVGSGFTNPAGVAVDSYGNIYVSDSSAKSVTKIVAGTGAQVILATNASAGLSHPAGLAVDSYGNVFVADAVANVVIEIPFNGSEAVQLGSGLDAPTGVAVDPAGSLYIADGKNSRIVFIPNESTAQNTSNLNTLDQIAIITNAQLVTPLGTPSGVAVAGNGTVYVADSSNNAIYTFVRTSASFNFGGVATDAPPPTIPADIISMGNEPVTPGSAFWTPSSNNSTDFSLSPSSIPDTSSFPDAGYGVPLTATFTPLTVQSGLSAVYTFGATNVTQPTLSLSGSGQLHGSDTSTLTLTAPPPIGQTSWIYGQTVTLNVTESVTASLPAPTGNVIVTVGTATYTVPLTSGSGSVQIPNLIAGLNAITASYGGDDNFASTTGSLNLTLSPEPLIVTVDSLSKPFDAPIKAGFLTGSMSGVVNNDSIGVTYSTTATQGSPVVAGGYPITAALSGGAIINYAVTNIPGTLTILPDTTVTSLGASATSVNSTTQVTLTATVSNQTAYSIVSIPTGSVTFFNTVGTATTQIGTGQINPATGIATYPTTFAVVGSTTNNSVTAVYSGDTNFVTSTSAPLVITSGAPTFTLTPGTNSSLTVTPGQSGLMSFTLSPAYGYNGTITFSCTGASATVSCSFSPSSVSPNGSTTPILVAATFNTTQSASSQPFDRGPSGIHGASKVPFTLAAIPGLALLFGVSRLRRKFLRGYGFLLFAALCIYGLSLTGCGGINSTPGTPAGNETVTVVATGTGGSFASVTHQFNVSLTVQ